MRWTKVELGEQLTAGSWSRAVVKGNEIMILGNAAGNAAADYGQRQVRSLRFYLSSDVALTRTL